MVALFPRHKAITAREGVSDVEQDPTYQAWLDSNPPPGEVFVHTGEPTAEDSRKLRWSPTREQREMAKRAIAAEVTMVNRLFTEDVQEDYIDRIEELVGETLRNAGVNPATLQPLSDAAKSSSAQSSGQSR
jgi:hypothetical protein